MRLMLVKGLSFSDVSENDSEPDDAARIVGGSDANPAKYPYLASLWNGGPNGETFCGGALIAPQYVLTAGHCFEWDLNGMYATLGMRHASGKGTNKSEHIRVSGLFRHPKFNSIRLTYDVALVKLETPSTRRVLPLAAADGSNNKPGTMATVVGWGLANNETLASTLKYVEIEILSNEVCDSGANQMTSETLMCAGAGGGKDSCQGDSGGPLIADGVAVGIVSGGVPGDCGLHPGLHTRVTTVLDYIHDVLNGGSSGQGDCASDDALQLQ